MKKALALILVFGMVLALGVTAHAESKEINIFMWSDLDLFLSIPRLSPQCIGWHVYNL